MKYPDMQYFSVPADFKEETLRIYDKINKTYPNGHIAETYGQITVDNPYGSGRAQNLLPVVDIQTMRHYIEYSNRLNIRFNYILNSTCLGNQELTQTGVQDLRRFIYDLYDSGVRSLTVTLPAVIELIRSLPLDIEIKASTACRIDNVNKAAQYRNMGVDRIVVHESIHRDFHTLAAICAYFGTGSEIIVNSICHKNCIYQQFHLNQTSHENTFVSNHCSDYYTVQCMLSRYKSPSEFLKLAWIRPEDISQYEAVGFSNFKIQGRHLVQRGDVPRTVEQYINGKYQGNLFQLLDCFAPTNTFLPDISNHQLTDFLYPFVKNDRYCQNNCNQCHYCDQYAQAHLDVNQLTLLCKKANLFYKNYSI